MSVDYTVLAGACSPHWPDRCLWTTESVCYRQSDPVSQSGCACCTAGLAKKYYQVLQRYYVQYMSGYDADLLNQLIQVSQSVTMSLCIIVTSQCVCMCGCVCVWMPVCVPVWVCVCVDAGVCRCGCVCVDAGVCRCGCVFGHVLYMVVCVTVD